MALRTKKPPPLVISPARFPSDSWDLILASLEEGIIIIAETNDIAYANQTVEQLTGLSHAQLHGRSYLELFSANPWVLEIIHRTVASDNSRTAGEGELRGRMARSTPVRLTCSPIFNDSGTFLGMILVLHDLSYQKELEETVQREDRLVHLGGVAAGLAHEIKNPLAGIRGAAQLLQSRLRHDPSGTEYATVMMQEIDRLSGLLEQVLTLSSSPPLEARPINVHKILTEVLLLERATLSPHQRIHTHFDPSLPDVGGDEAQLGQVFRNLVKNALQAIAGRRGGELTIATRMATDFHLLRSEAQKPSGTARRGRVLAIDFADNGSGIAPEQLARLFTPFFTTKTKGTGLGLAISQKIVAQHGGTIRVESDPGVGTVFHVYLPVATV
ncbi:MAG: PAS domain-containing protein [Deltaproteobacteria bacterium]|nr:PAS domain-containing protein [Deltaproteobacteria bacterium]